MLTRVGNIGRIGAYRVVTFTVTYVYISGTLPPGVIGQPYSASLTASGPTEISPSDAAMLAGFGFAWNGSTSTISGTLL